MRKTVISIAALFLVGLLLLSVCDPTGEEPEEVLLALVSDGSASQISANAEGWAIELTDFRLAVRDFEFTVEGEAHSSLLDRALCTALICSAHAHPGHLAGGDVTGELKGYFVIDALQADAQTLGNAKLLEGHYHGMNFTFGKATLEYGIEQSSSLFNHTAIIAGTAKRDENAVQFTAVVDVDDNIQMVGAPLDITVTSASSETLALEILPENGAVQMNMFDGIDFGTLATFDSGTVSILPGDAAHNILMKALARHDYYNVKEKSI